MKKKILLIFSIIIITSILYIWSIETRKFICIEKNCITIWRTQNDSCYIIPGIYRGLLKPKNNFIKTDDLEVLTIFFSDELPNALIYRSDDPLKIFPDRAFTFYDYNSDPQKFLSILYPFNATKSSGLKSNAYLMDISIEENYVMDKNGKILDK